MKLLRHTFHALGGPCSLCLQGDADVIARGVELAQAEVLRIEAKYSRYRDDSVLSRINASAGDARGVEVDAETAALFDYAAVAHAQSDGLFDATSGVLRRAWDFRAQRVPTQAQLDALLPLVGWHKIIWQSPRIVLPLAGMQLDFGGFGKEYAVDRVVALLRAAGLAQGYVELGGDIGVIGAPSDAPAWQIGVRHPHEPARAIAQVALSSGAIATSGDYERGFESNGRRYSHLLDARSGWPVTGPASVSVLAPQCLIAGTASTIAMLKGAQAQAWLDGLGLPWLAVQADGTLRGSVSYEVLRASA